MPRLTGSAAVHPTPQSADDVLSPEQVARLDAREFLELRDRTLQSAARLLVLATQRTSPGPELLAAVHALHVAARDLSALMAWLVPASR